MINYGRGKRNETKKTNRQKREEEGEGRGERKEDVRCGSVSVCECEVCALTLQQSPPERVDLRHCAGP